MYENNLFIKDCIICDTSDGCRKQYRCKNVIWILSALEFTYIVIIYIFINSLGNGRSKIDGINGSENTYLKQGCA